MAIQENEQVQEMRALLQECLPFMENMIDLATLEESITYLKDLVKRMEQCVDGSANTESGNICLPHETVQLITNMANAYYDLSGDRSDEEDAALDVAFVALTQPRTGEQ